MSGYQPYNPDDPYNNPQGYVPPQGEYQQSSYPQLSPYDNVPQYQENAPNSKLVETEERFEYQGSKYRDKCYAILFVLHLLAIIACAIVFSHYVTEHWSKIDTKDPDSLQITGRQLITSLGAAGIVGLVFGAVWLYIMKKCSDTIIKISLTLNCILMVIMAGVAVYQKAYWMAILFGIFAVFQCLYFYCVRHRIPFTQAVITASVSSIQANPGSINVAYAMAVLQVVWITLWGFATAAITYHFDSGSSDRTTVPHGITWFLLLVSFYWTTQVLKNIGHVTTSGSVASWWLVPNTSSPTCGAFKRSMTTSFGSICFGSLIVAALQALRAVVRQAKESARRSDNGAAACALCCLECIVSSLDRLIQYFNMYAYTHVAIYGKDFISAAKDTWRLFSERGFDVLINDDLTGMVLTMGCFLGGIASCVVGGGVGYASTNDTKYVWQTLASISFLIGFAMTALIMNVVQSAVATSYVIWAEMPNEISNTRPQHYNKLVDAARILHPGGGF